jgi:hypothetical protein
MKKILAFVILCSSVSAFAECYTFTNGEGPARIGKAYLKRTARQMCLNTTPRYSNIEFGDKTSELAVVEAVIRRERSLDGEVVADLGMANVNSIVEDLRGVTVVIKRGQPGQQREILIGKKSYFANLK